MAKLVFQPIADQIASGTYLLYDGACGTGGMLTVAEETLQELAAEHGKEVATHLYGQEINAETFAICKADLLLKGEGEAAGNIVGGPEHSTLSNDANPGREFDFMLSGVRPPRSATRHLHAQRTARQSFPLGVRRRVAVSPPRRSHQAKVGLPLTPPLVCYQGRSRVRMEGLQSLPVLGRRAARSANTGIVEVDNQSAFDRWRICCHPE